MKPVHDPQKLYDLHGSVLVDYCAQVISRLSENASIEEIRHTLIDISCNFPLETEGIEASMETHHVLGTILDELSRLEHLDDEKRSLAWQMPLAREILWRCELHRRGETPSNYTLGIDAISWIIFAALGAALRDYEEGDDLMAAIARIDVEKAANADIGHQRPAVVKILRAQLEAGLIGHAHYDLVNAMPWDVGDVTVIHNFGIAEATAGVLDENMKLRFRTGANCLTIYQRIPETLVAGVHDRPLRELITHPLIDSLSYVITAATSKPDRTIIDLEPLDWMQVKLRHAID